MPAERFYVESDLDGVVEMEGKEHHHLAHVMRIGLGEEVELINGRGGLARGRLTHLGKERASFQIVEVTFFPLPPPRIHLGLPLMRGSKIEWVIEKCTELGADAFYLYRADHSEKEQLSDHAFERLSQIAIGAIKQCGRLDLPPIQFFSFKTLLDQSLPILFGDLQAGTSPTPIEGPFLFITGPEKGFGKKEKEQLRDRGKGIQLHKNILRAETAPIVATVVYTK